MFANLSSISNKHVIINNLSLKILFRISIQISKEFEYDLCYFLNCNFNNKIK